MSETKFTPGPWRADIGSMERFVVQASDESLIAWVNYRGEDDDTDDRRTQELNAHLVAAAPDLYAACDALANAKDLLGFFGAQLHAREALKKARGEA